ncbi:hypothetical protein ACFFV7_12230 [Nonomuraea spiralis]|uniref:Uncharacterized protein n=1 Tax=Nonomuraea spiralis TaxID=46182 RepID=A0ABV5IBP8_9ACTN|nr:hypothetical protein [Nonomuraea spiralis]GGS79930.1 hypothetical protein GCM10010176_024150 [Nonomuraea spiralis]
MSLRALLIAVILLASGIAVVQTLNLSTTVRAVLSVAAALLAAMTLFLLVKNLRKNRIGRTDTDVASSGNAGAAQSTVGAVNSSGLTLGVVAIGVASFAATNVLGPIVNRYFPEFGVYVDDLLDSSALDIEYQWPIMSDCDVRTAVAMQAGGRSLGSYSFTFREDPRVTVASAGGMAWDAGGIVLSFSAKKNRNVVVHSISPIILGVEDKPRVAWVLQKSKGCGGGDDSPYLLLDLKHSKLLIVKGKKKFDSSAASGPKIRDFPVSMEKSITVPLVVEACSGLYRWMLKVEYSVDGVRTEQTIGSEKKPLLAAGGIAGVPIYDIVPAKSGVGRTVEATGGNCGR